MLVGREGAHACMAPTQTNPTTPIYIHAYTQIYTYTPPPNPNSAKLKARKVQALTRRLACYVVALMLLVAGFSTFLAVPAAQYVKFFKLNF